MSEVFFYRGLYKVKVLTISEGYYIVEALEDFEDLQDGKRVEVKTGEQRIVQPSELHKRKVLGPPVPEHVYERRQEKEIKRMVEKIEEENTQKP